MDPKTTAAPEVLPGAPAPHTRRPRSKIYVTGSGLMACDEDTLRALFQHIGPMFVFGNGGPSEPFPTAPPRIRCCCSRLLFAV